MTKRTPPRVRDVADFRQLVRQNFEALPPQQQLVARYLVEQIHEIPFLSIPELAERSGASEATVVRFAQRVGYRGFSALKMELLEAVREKVVPRSEVGQSDASRTENDSLAAVLRQELQNLRRTVEDLDREAYRRLAASLFRADHVFSFGLGISSYFAELTSYLMAQIGLRATTLSTRFSSPLEQLVPLRPTDLLVVFSFPPYSRQTLEVVRQTSERGIPTAAICDSVTAPVASLTEQVIAVRSDNLLFTNSFAAVGMLLNALTTEIAVRHQDHTFEALARINRILEEDGDLIEDSR